MQVRRGCSCWGPRGERTQSSCGLVNELHLCISWQQLWIFRWQCHLYIRWGPNGNGIDTSRRTREQAHARLLQTRRGWPRERLDRSAFWRLPSAIRGPGVCGGSSTRGMGRHRGGGHFVWGAAGLCRVAAAFDGRWGAAGLCRVAAAFDGRCTVALYWKFQIITGLYPHQYACLYPFNAVQMITYVLHEHHHRSLRHGDKHGSGYGSATVRQNLTGFRVLAVRQPQLCRCSQPRPGRSLRTAVTLTQKQAPPR